MCPRTAKTMKKTYITIASLCTDLGQKYTCPQLICMVSYGTVTQSVSSGTKYKERAQTYREETDKDIVEVFRQTVAPPYDDNEVNIWENDG